MTASVTPIDPRGSIDIVDGGHVSGWVYDESGAFRDHALLAIGDIILPLSVEALRTDVAEAGKAPVPDAGFVCSFTTLDEETRQRLDDMPVEERTIELRIGDALVATGGPLPVSIEATSQPRGSIDRIDEIAIEGWVFDDAGRHRREARLMVGDVVIPLEVGVARPDVFEAGGAPEMGVGYRVTSSDLDQATAAALADRLVRRGAKARLFIGDDLVVQKKCRVRPTFNVSASAGPSGEIEGWVTAKEPPPAISVEIACDGRVVETIRLRDVDMARARAAGVGWGASFRTRLACLPDVAPGPARLTASIAGALVSTQAEMTVELPGRVDRREAIASACHAAAGHGLTIVVPIHNAADAVEECITSLLRHAPQDCRILLIDDASTQREIAPLLEDATSDARVRVIRNGSNLGYTKTINLGIAETGSDDVILLNSDTRVTPRFADRLRLAAWSAADIGSVTAVSDNAGAFSVSLDHPALADWSDEALARLVARASGLVWPEAPTGSGFCCYLRRDCLDATGPFDEETFPRGYGEENDFSLRAIAGGWRHVVDERTLVFHRRAASLGGEKEALLEKAQSILLERYPDYHDRVARFVTGQGMNLVRARLGAAVASAGSQPRPRIAFVLSMTAGGTAHTNDDLMASLGDEIEPLLISCDGREMLLCKVEGGGRSVIERHVLATPVDPVSHRSTEYDAVLGQWLVAHDIELVHVRHIAHHSLGLSTVTRGLGIPCVFSFHDYYAACPTVKLLDEKNVFCSGQCTAPGVADCTPELWPDRSLPPLKHAWVHRWRSAFGDMLAQCDRHVTTSQAAASVISNSFPSLERGSVDIVPHGRNFEAVLPPAFAAEKTGPLRILVPGMLTPAKGRDLIQAVSDLDTDGNLEFHILGEAPGLTAGKNIILHGSYDRADFPERARRIDAEIGAVLSIWAETWCHTLTELWAAGLPVLGLDIGAVGERLRGETGGWLVSLDNDNLAAALHAKLVSLHGDRSLIAAKADGVSDIQARLAEQTTQHMAQRYMEIYADCGLALKQDR